jgi:hypothetical protein
MPSEGKSALSMPSECPQIFVYVLKIEYVYKINIFGLKMMAKSGLEKIFLKFLHAEDIFY